MIESAEAFGGFYAISERLFGEALDGLGPARMREALPSILETLDAIRAVDVSGSTGYGGWRAGGVGQHTRWRGALLDIQHDRPADRIHGWRSRLAESALGDRHFNQAFAQLTSLVERCPEARYLVHADLLNNNVLVAGDRVAAVLDWGCSMYGDFLYDLAWLTFWQPWYPAWRGIDLKQAAVRRYETIGLDVPQFEQRLRCYEIHIGLASQKYNAFKGRWANVESAAERTSLLATPRLA